MPTFELFLLLMTFVVGLGTLAQRFTVPYPIFFVIGGLLISLIPQLPPIVLDPELTFVLFLPPLLYIQAYNTSWRDFKSDLRPITQLAIGLVLATTLTVAFVAHWLIPDFPLAAGFVLGAIISPPDAIAASAIAEHLHLPRRIVTILEGESLVNDATGLVLLKIGLAALAGATFSFYAATGQFVLVSLGGILVGLLVGYLVSRLRPYIAGDSPRLTITLSVIFPFASYLLAERLECSGVLAVVSTGLYLGWRAPEQISAEMRLRGAAFWDLLTYWLNGVIFVLIGLELPVIMSGLKDESWALLIYYALIVNLVCVVVRIAWVFPGAYVPRWLSPTLRARDPYPDWRYVLIISWSGMRGVVSLAAALSLQGLAFFPHRELAQFLAFSVILFSLIVQGLTLPALIARLGVGDDGIPQREEVEARRQITKLALEKLGQVREKEDFPALILDKVEGFYRDRHQRLHERVPDEAGLSELEHQALTHQQLRQMMIAAERSTLIHLRHEGHIGDDVLHKIERELDIQDAMLKSG